MRKRILNHEDVTLKITERVAGLEQLTQGGKKTLPQLQFVFEMLQTHFNSCDPKWLPEYSLLPSGNLANKLGQEQSLERSATKQPRS